MQSTPLQEMNAGNGWAALLRSDDLDDWRMRGGELLGPHEIHLGKRSAGMSFHHQIRGATLGPLQLVAFRGGGSFALERIPAPEAPC